jgi:hypothetical protein
MHSRSFADDPTRILRALRFAQRFGYRIEPDTHQWLRQAVKGGYLDDVSGDRVRKELRCTLGEAPVEGPLLLAEEDVLDGLQEGLGARREALLRLQELMDWYAGLKLPREPRAPAWALVLACCAERLPQQARWALVRRLRLSRGERSPLIESGAPWQSASAELAARGGAGQGLAPSLVERSLRALSADALLVATAVSEPGDPRIERVREHLAELRWITPDLDGGICRSSVSRPARRSASSSSGCARRASTASPPTLPKSAGWCAPGWLKNRADTGFARIRTRLTGGGVRGTFGRSYACAFPASDARLPFQF